jgi:hypothetical protein
MRKEWEAKNISEKKELRSACEGLAPRIVGASKGYIRYI